MSNLYYGHMLDWGWGVGGMAIMLIFWVAVILFIVWAVKGSRENDSGKSQSKSAMDILQNRYAKGEIDKKEFEEKKKDLTD